MSKCEPESFDLEEAAEELGPLQSERGPAAIHLLGLYAVCFAPMFLGLLEKHRSFDIAIYACTSLYLLFLGFMEVDQSILYYVLGIVFMLVPAVWFGICRESKCSLSMTYWPIVMLNIGHLFILFSIFIPGLYG